MYYCIVAMAMLCLSVCLSVCLQVKLNGVLPLLGRLLDKLSQPVEVAMETDKPGPHGEQCLLK